MQTMKRKGYKGAGMEGWVARWYTRTRGNDLKDFHEQAALAAKNLSGGSRVLEVAPGPGFFAIELARLGDFQITALDISRSFVEIAAENARLAGVKIDFQLGNASAMPFADGSFDFAYCSAAFKNFTEPVQAIDEMHRVLRPGGEAVIVDLRKDVSLDDIDAYVRESGRKRVDAWMTNFTFRHMLVKRAYTLADFNRMAEQSRFGGCKFQLGRIGFEARFKKPMIADRNIAQ
jgi:ubiquinone/menaquinone biosynthesis C-methylase UbiE